MCTMHVDIRVENGHHPVFNDEPVTITCEEGRVILAATAHVGTDSTARPLAVMLSEGEPVNTCRVFPSTNAIGNTTGYIRYSLTTALPLTRSADAQTGA